MAGVQKDKTRCGVCKLILVSRMNLGLHIKTFIYIYKVIVQFYVLAFSVQGVYGDNSI